MKVFECFWSGSYRRNNRSILEWHGEDFFTEDKGYQSHDIEEIQSLEAGESINLSCVTGEHWIMRIE
jgi:hypothetical protein